MSVPPNAQNRLKNTNAKRLSIVRNKKDEKEGVNCMNGAFELTNRKKNEMG